ncbi:MULTISPECIES: fluoride efflux transporter CrcB [Rhodomicrobium]|uniref:fluoride efflux transporter CrcB n=1 Tax=Rhodomicrobium TaxID=1068 RepID=UPI000B4BA6E0|nr:MULTISPECIES: fluoride efflux transporter CrcB [Rhodomicrobium]
MKLLLLAAIGGAIGSSARYLVNVTSAQLFGTNFPWGTLAVNIVGCFIMGLVVALGALKFNMTNEVRVFIATGILGGFTTFSAFSLDFALLVERKDYGLAGFYLAGSVGLSILAIFAGLYLVRTWLT